MKITLTSPYFAEVELDNSDMGVFVSATQAVRTQLLDAVLRKHRVPKLVIEPGAENIYAEFEWHTDTIRLNNRLQLPPPNKRPTDFVAYRGRNDEEYRQGILIHECGHWLWKTAPAIRERITACRNRSGINFISRYAGFDGAGEYFSENLLAFEWLNEELRTFDGRVYAMVEEVLHMLM